MELKGSVQRSGNRLVIFNGVIEKLEVPLYLINNSELDSAGGTVTLFFKSGGSFKFTGEPNKLQQLHNLFQ